MIAGGDRLTVVVPVFNEEHAVAAVIREWTETLAGLNIDYRFLLLNDGSTDSTAKELDDLARSDVRIRVIHKINTGHGATCLHGYRLAVDGGADWVFQIDSDGQCDPRFFANLWGSRTAAFAVFGTRAERDDGWARHLISKTVSWTVAAATGIAAPDPNVPYRLMRSDVLRAAVDGFPSDFRLANILLAATLHKGLGSRIAYRDIRFRRRQGGTASVKWFRFAAEAVSLVRSLRRNREYLNRTTAALAAMR